jgi:arsenite/tail-anchored protein-transporting ATPase
MRIILYTGKGGVGKTSVAAATARRTAQLGYRTIVLSTDAAHSLADSFDRTLGPDPEEIAPNLWGQQVETLHQLDEHWGVISEYMSSVLAWRGMDELTASEMTVLPGLEELTSLLEIVDHHDSGLYDVIVVDCAPTGETIRLLSFPEVAKWWLEKIFPFERQAAKILRPVLRPLIDIPLPDDQLFDAVKRAMLKLDRMHNLLADQNLSSVRLVLNPEKMVIKEAQRTYTYLHLFGYSTDVIVCNRLIPESVTDAYFDAWKESQRRYKEFVDECFAPLPILGVPLFDQEVVGTEMLDRMAEAIYGSGDPSQFYFRGETHRLVRQDGGYSLNLPLPFVTKQDIDLRRAGDELVVQVGSYKRNLVLPRALLKFDVRGAKFVDSELRIRFDPRVPAPNEVVARKR